MAVSVSSTPSSCASSLSNTFDFNSIPRLSISSSSSSYSKPSFYTSQFTSPPLLSHRRLPHLATKPILLLLSTSDSTHFPSGNIKSRRFSKAPFAYEDSTVKNTTEESEITQDKVPTSENESVQMNSCNLKSLITLYKKAILDGDHKTISDVESMVCIVQNEKDKLTEEVSALSKEINSGKEKYIRLQADFDNYRKRSEKDKLTIRSDAQGEVIESLLPMVDNFERAKQQIKLETEKEKKIDASYQGIYKQFVEIMRSFRVSVVATVGNPFDPSLHEAIAREESQEFKEGIIIQEFRRGFLLGERLLRPAMVKVSAGPGKKRMTAPNMVAEHTSPVGVDEQ